jgi:hypothetical protein
MKRLGMLLFGFLCSAAGAWSQSGNASLSGSISDPSGAIVQNAQVLVTNTATGVAKTTRTNSAGLYVVLDLIPGDYELSVTAPGFQERRISDIKLVVGQRAALDISLALGATNEQVDVSSAPPLLQAEEASVGTVVRSQEVLNLPLNGRFFSQLLELSPGATPSIRSAQFASSDPNLSGKERNGMPAFDVNGQSGAFTYFRIDGIDNTERQFGGANIPVSVDAIQEFRLQTANFSAEYGRSAAQVDVATKSGTNQIHGSLFEFLRNTDLDATQWTYAGAHVPDLRKRNQFGGSVGGPIKKDKLFYFFNFDGTRETYTAPQVLTVPSNTMRTGTFPSGVIIFDPLTQQAFPNNTIPRQRMDPITQKVLGVLPAPNLPGTPVVNPSGFQLDPINNYFYVPRHQQTINQYNVRIDFIRSEKDTFMGRYTYSSNDNIGDGPLATNIQNSIVGSEIAHLGGQQLSTAWYHNFSPSTINEFRFGFLTDPQNYAKGDTTDYPAQLGLSQFLFPNYYPGLPHFQIGSVNLGSGDYRPLQVSQKDLEFVDNVTLVRGRHQIRAGVEVRKTLLLRQNGQLSDGRFYFNGAETRDRKFPGTGATYCPGGTNPSGCIAGDAMADFLLGDMSLFARGAPVLATDKTYGTTAGYVNDTWHLRRNVVLTLGLRYEYTSRAHANSPTYALPLTQNGEFTGKVGIAGTSATQLSSDVLPQALAALPNTFVPCPSVGLPANCLFAEKKDFQPRVGVAWSLNSKTVVRAGAGIFYQYTAGDADTEFGQKFPFILISSVGTFTQPPAGNAPPPLQISQLTPTSAAPIGTPVMPANAADMRIPSSYQWNLSVERALTGGTTVAAAYVGNLGRHQVDGNQYCCYVDIPQPAGVVLAAGQTQQRVDPRFSNIEIYTNLVSSSYQSLQLKGEHRFSSGFAFTLAYTYSKDLGTIPGLGDPRFPSQDRGPLTIDVNQNFVASSIWQVPLGANGRWLRVKGVANQLIGGWQLNNIFTRRSGFPFTPTMSGTDLLHYNGFDGPDRPDRICDGANSNPTLFNWFNKSCFVLPAEPTTPGALLRDGNSGVNILRGPHAFGWDLGLSKTFPIRERFNLDFRSEFFNVLNHPSFGLPNSGIAAGGNNAPAQITSVTSLPRIIQFALKVRF